VARLSLILAILFLSVHADRVRAAVTSAQARTHARFLKGCEDGNGLACYNYGRALWSTPGIIDHKAAIKYFLRGCQLKFELACQAANDHSTSTRKSVLHKKTQPGEENASGPCFVATDMQAVIMVPHQIGSGAVQGQIMTKIKKGSFWERIGVRENDIVLRVNNMPFNTHEEIMNAFGTSGKKFAFEVERGSGPTTLWYTCF